MPCASWELRVACNRIEIPVAILIRREAGREVPEVYRFSKAIFIGYLAISQILLATYLREGFNNPSHGNFPLRGGGVPPPFR